MKTCLDEFHGTESVLNSSCCEQISANLDTERLLKCHCDNLDLIVLDISNTL